MCIVISSSTTYGTPMRSEYQELQDLVLQVQPYAEVHLRKAVHPPSKNRSLSKFQTAISF